MYICIHVYDLLGILIVTVKKGLDLEIPEVSQ